MNYSKRNYILMFIDTILFVNAMAFLSINAVIPYFLSEMGARTFHISLASALVSIGAFATQPIFAQLAMGLKVKHRRFTKLLVIQRLIFLLYVVSIPFIGKVNPGLSVMMFLLFWGIFNLFVGSYSPFFMSIFSKIIAVHQRGRLIGFSGAVGNIFALGAAFLVGMLLRNNGFPYNYAWVFGIGTFLLLLDALVFAALKEEPEPVKKIKVSYLGYVKDMPRAMKSNPKFKKAVIANGILVTANLSMAFYSLYAIRNFHAGPAEIAVFTAIAVTVNVVGSSIFGVVADRYGHCYVLQGAAVFGVLAALAVLGIQDLSGVYIAFALGNLCVSGYNISCSMHIIQYSPPDQIPLYISINMMITLLMSSTATLLGGLIIDWLSFVPVFAFAGLAAAVGFFMLHLFFSGRRSIDSQTENLTL